MDNNKLAGDSQKPLEDGIYFQMATVKNGVVIPVNKLMSASLFIETVVRKTSDAILKNIEDMYK